MAAIVELTSATPGNTCYAVINDLAGKRWNGTAFETFNGANWSNYVVALTEDRSGAVGTGYYKAAFPATIQPGRYTFTFYQQAGGSPAVGDPTIGSGGPMFWTGSNEDQGTVVTGLGLFNGTAMPELTSLPAPTPSLFQALMLLYMSLRNKHLATSVQETITNDAGLVVTTSVLTDDGTTYTKAKFS